jgi:hypothetical protein
MQISSSSLGESVVLTLKKYGTIPIAFLAKLHNREPSEIEGYLETLETAGIIERHDGNVTLSASDKHTNTHKTDTMEM